MKKTSLILALIMLVSCFAACAGDVKPEDTTAAAVTSNDVSDNSEAETTVYVPDEMGTLDYGGRDFTIFFFDDISILEFNDEGTSGDIINDAVYERDCKVEDRTKVNLQLLHAPGRWPEIDSFCAKVENELNGGTTGFDMILGHNMDAGVLAVKGLCADLNQVDGFEWDKPWWPEYLMSLLKIKDKLYFASGDISVNTILSIYATFFNKDMIEDRNLEDPYVLMQNDQWTLDKMWEMCKDMYDDKNSNGIIDFGDSFGNFFEWEAIDGYTMAAGLTFLSNKNGELTLGTDMFGQKGIEVFDKLTNYSHDKTAAYLYEKSGATGSEGRREFSNGLVLFWVEPIECTAQIFESGLNYGILPVPKIYDGQQDFYTPMDFAGMAIIPYNVPNKEESAKVIEIFASESYRTTTPKVFDITMKYRYANDKDASDLFDLMRSRMTFDPVLIFSPDFDHPYNTLRRTIINSVGWSGAGKTLSKTMQNTLTRLLKNFD